MSIFDIGYTGYLQPHLELIDGLRKDGQGSMDIARELYAKGARAHTSFDENGHISALAGLVNYLLRKAEGKQKPDDLKKYERRVDRSREQLREAEEALSSARHRLTTQDPPRLFYRRWDFGYYPSASWDQASVDMLELSVRASNVLCGAFGDPKISTVAELVRETESSLLLRSNCGRHTLAEIKTVLAERGLELGMQRPNSTCDFWATG